MFKEKVLLTINRHNLLKQGERVLIGVSGGKDSVSLLYILKEIEREYNLSLFIAHLNHLFRGKEAEGDARYVQRLGKRLSIPTRVERFDVPKFIKMSRLSAEEGARVIRYRFYHQIAREVGANKLALGHTADDNVETVLMRFLRGAGIDGLVGIPPLREEGGLVIIRPLIEVWEEEVEDYCQRLKIKPREDSSNQSLDYLRNRIRLKLLPQLRREYNLEIKESILGLVKTLRSDYDYLKEETKNAFLRVLVEESSERVSLEVKGLLKLSLSLRMRVLREAIRKIKGDLKGISLENIEGVLTLLEKGRTGKKLSLPDKIWAEREYDYLIVFKEEKERKSFDFNYRLKIPGITEIKELGIEIEANILTRAPDRRDILVPQSTGVAQAYFDYQLVGEQITLRRKKPGDKFIPLGMNDFQKLKKFFIDKKVPQKIRDNVPVVATSDQIIWIVGYRMDERVRVTKKTKQVLELKVIKTNPKSKYYQIPNKSKVQMPNEN